MPSHHDPVSTLHSSFVLSKMILLLTGNDVLTKSSVSISFDGFVTHELGIARVEGKVGVEISTAWIFGSQMSASGIAIGIRQSNEDVVGSTSSSWLLELDLES